MKFLSRILVALLLFFPLDAHAEILLSQLYIDPTGVDSGQEWISLINTGTGAVALNNWLLDINNLPDLIFTSETTLQPQEELFLHFRSNGTSTGNHLHFPDSFTTQNITNTSGFIALYEGSNKNTAPMRDYMLYGAANGSFSSKAASTGLWQPNWFLTVPEGIITKRTNIVTPHTLEAWSLVPSVPEPLPSPPPPTASGSTILPPATSSGTTVLPPETSSGSTIAPPITNHPPFPVITIQGNGAKSGNAPFNFNVTGESSTDPDGDQVSFLWDFGNGITTDRANPLTVSYTTAGTYIVHLTVVDTAGNSTTTSVEVQVHSSSTSSTSSGTSSATTSSTQCTPSTNLGTLLLSEILPNPEGTDTDHEWIELYNPSETTVELCGWNIDDKEGESDPFRLHTFSLLSHAFYIIESSLSEISLSNTADIVRLFSPLQQLVDSVSYSNAPSGKSYARKLP